MATDQTRKWLKTAADEVALAEGCFFDLAAAERVRAFLQKFIRHPAGNWAGRPLELDEWQWSEVVAPLFGWKRPYGRRRFRALYLEVVDGGGKTTLAAALALYLLVADGQRESIILSAGHNAGRAGEVHQTIVDMVQASSGLAEHVSIEEGRLVFGRTMSECRPGWGEWDGVHGIVADDLNLWRGGVPGLLEHLQQPEGKSLAVLTAVRSPRPGAAVKEVARLARGILSGEGRETWLLPAIRTDREVVFPSPPPEEGDPYERHKQDMARRAREKSLSGRDIGPIPKIASLERRESCRDSLRLFCETYNPEAFYLGWSDSHLRMIARIEEAIRQGGLFAFAMPRGEGKSSICRMATLWAISFRLCRYVFLIGANAPKAEDSLDAIRTWIRFQEKYAADFPEISYPARCLGGIANRASGQICQGQSTLIRWAEDHLVLPTVPPPPNWPEHWALRRDGMVPTSGSVVSTSGLTGEGIRGSLVTLTTGEQVRPDLVLLDDPQTPESSRSPTQNAVREQLVSADILGMAGPDKPIAAVMPCTIIHPGDMVERMLDRSKHPLWRGERTQMLRSMPANMGAWDKYFEVYQHCAQLEPPDYTEANEYYLAHRSELDAGAEPSWPQRIQPPALSAIQHAMHLYFRDQKAFWAEYQNQPLPDHEENADLLTADQIAARTNGLPRGLVPLWATRLTAAVDVQKDLLYWVVCAWNDGFTGHVVDYGTFPDQKRTYFSLRDANPILADVTGVHGAEAQLYKGLTMLVVDNLLSRAFRREDGQEFRIERLLIDASYLTEVIRQWCRQCGRQEAMPAFGRFFGAGAAPMTDWKQKTGERKGLHWIVSKHVTFDSNWWKSLLQARLATDQPNPGCLTLWGDNPHHHRLIADHLTSETRERQESSRHGRKVDVWHLLPGHDNHWLDGLVMNCVAASVQGSSLTNMTQPGLKTERKKVSFRDLQEQARAKK